FSNRVNPAAAAGPNNEPIAEGKPGLFAVAQGQGPGPSVETTNVQLFGANAVSAGATLEAPNDRGFVQNYKAELAVDGFSGAGADLSAVMQTFVPGQLRA